MLEQAITKAVEKAIDEQLDARLKAYMAENVKSLIKSHVWNFLEIDFPGLLRESQNIGLLVESFVKSKLEEELQKVAQTAHELESRIETARQKLLEECFIEEYSYDELEEIIKTEIIEMIYKKESYQLEKLLDIINKMLTEHLQTVVYRRKEEILAQLVALETEIEGKAEDINDIIYKDFGNFYSKQISEYIKDQASYLEERIMKFVSDEMDRNYHSHLEKLSNINLDRLNHSFQLIEESAEFMSEDGVTEMMNRISKVELRLKGLEAENIRLRMENSRLIGLISGE